MKSRITNQAGPECLRNPSPYCTQEVPDWELKIEHWLNDLFCASSSTLISTEGADLLEAVAVVYRAGSEQCIALQVHLGGDVAHGVLELGTGCVSMRHTSNHGQAAVPWGAVVTGQLSCLRPGLVKHYKVTHFPLKNNQQYESSVIKYFIFISLKYQSKISFSKH